MLWAGCEKQQCIKIIKNEQIKNHPYHSMISLARTLDDRRWGEGRGKRCVEVFVAHAVV